MKSFLNYTRGFTTEQWREETSTQKILTRSRFCRTLRENAGEQFFRKIQRATLAKVSFFPRTDAPSDVPNKTHKGQKIRIRCFAAFLSKTFWSCKRKLPPHLNQFYRYLFVTRNSVEITSKFDKLNRQHGWIRIGRFQLHLHAKKVIQTKMPHSLWATHRARTEPAFLWEMEPICRGLARKMRAVRVSVRRKVNYPEADLLASR